MYPLTKASQIGHFNSQPHREADTRQHMKTHHSTISTHSLTGRLTKDTSISPASAVISTHSLTGRLTSKIAAMIVDMAFQLTASQGG